MIPSGRLLTGRPRLLVIYATEWGSTAGVAEAIADELRNGGAEVDLSAIGVAPSPALYDGVVIGGPMIRGWHKDAVHYVASHRADLAGRSVAYFLTALSLTDTGEDDLDGIPLFADARLAKAPRRAGRLGLAERYARPRRYLRGVLRKAPLVRPVSVAFLGGSLNLMRLNIFQRQFVLLVVRASPRDARNWEEIHRWARELLPLLARRNGSLEESSP